VKGLHILADLHECRCEPALLQDAAALRKLCLSAVQEAGLQAVGELFHTFPAGDDGSTGVTCTVLLAESHLALHTWPEMDAVTLDVYVCNFGADNSAKASALTASLVAHFLPKRTEKQVIRRGTLS
jgi:S-adenosylmethionine decarboxylase